MPIIKIISKLRIHLQVSLFLGFPVFTKCWTWEQFSTVEVRKSKLYVIEQEVSIPTDVQFVTTTWLIALPMQYMLDYCHMQCNPTLNWTQLFCQRFLSLYCTSTRIVLNKNFTGTSTKICTVFLCVQCSKCHNNLYSNLIRIFEVSDIWGPDNWDSIVLLNYKTYLIT